MNTNTQHITKYKNSPLGLIPEDWEVKELGKIVNEKRPVSYGIVQTGEMVEGGVACIRVTDIVDGKIDKSNFITTSKKISESYKRTILKNGDLVMALRGKIGQIAKIDEDLVGSNLTRGVALIALKEDFDNEFIKQQISSDKAKIVFEKSLNGSALQELSIGILRKIPILIPKSLKEQKAIADCLSTWDTAIEKQNALIAQKELSKKALMQQLLSGKKRLKGFSGEWKIYELNKVCKINKGEQFNKIELDKVGKYPSFSGGIEPSGYTDKWNTDKDTIIVSEGGNSCGYVNFINTKFWCGGHCYALLNIKESFFKIFLFHSLKYNENKIMKLRVGSGLPNVQKKDLEKFCLIVPSIEEQTAIANVLQCADDELQLLKKKLEQLKEQKKGLMQVLLTGKKRLKY